MPPAVKFFTGLALAVLLLLASPFLAEAGLRAWDRRHDPWTLPGAVTMEAGPVRQGLNRRLLHEVRFPTTGIGLRLRAFGLPRESAEKFARPVRGTVRLLRLGGPDDAKPGPRPPAGAPELGSFAFRLETVSLRATSPSASRPGAAFGDPASPTPPETFEAVCELVAASPEDLPAAEAFSETFLAAGDSAEIDVDFRAPVPVSNLLEVVYSKRSRSLLRDTALQPLSDRLIGPEKGAR
jgi:hypothetical protein